MAETLARVPGLGVLDRNQLNRLRVILADYNATFPAELRELARSEWPNSMNAIKADPPMKAWRSRSFVALLFGEGQHRRLSVFRTKLNDRGQYEDAITWDELNALKREAGFGDCWMVELFPPDSEIVNVANMRHLWLIPGKPDFGWGK